VKDDDCCDATTAHLCADLKNGEVGNVKPMSARDNGKKNFFAIVEMVAPYRGGRKAGGATDGGVSLTPEANPAPLHSRQTPLPDRGCRGGGALRFGA
jgi:hypothetical protein